MATVAPVGTWVAKGVYKTVWSGITGSGTVVLPENGPRLPDKNIYIHGTFNSGIASLKGHNLSTGSATEAVQLVDPQGTDIQTTATTPFTEQVLENPMYIYPYVSGSTGATSLNFVMISRGDL
jgi:hypothetical protein